MSRALFVGALLFALGGCRPSAPASAREAAPATRPAPQLRRLEPAPPPRNGPQPERPFKPKAKKKDRQRLV